MGMIIIGGGPIDEYIRTTGKTISWFELALRNGDPNATSIFAAEKICKAISDLIVSVENIEYLKEE